MRKNIALIISLLPFNALRIAFFNVFLQYKISYSARIGMGTLIAVRRAVIGKDTTIGKFNDFSGTYVLTIGERTRIGSSNEFYSSTNPQTAHCTIGDEVHITKRHFFDASGGLTIQDQARIAGRGSQFWTHGGQRKQQSITIGPRCYIAAAVRISQGVDIPENCYIGLGSVVVASVEIPNALVFGNPATIVKESIQARLSLGHRES